MPLTRPLVFALLVAGVAMPAHGGPDGVLDLADGGSLPGALEPTAADAGPLTTVSWRAPLFGTPLQFRLDELTGIRFTPDERPSTAPFRCHLRGGDVVDGSIESIDDDHVVMATGAAEPVRISRSLVEMITRRDADGGASIGLGGLAAWKQTPAAAWREEAGRILTGQRNAALVRDLGAPARARYDVVLSWKRLPEFRLAVAAGSKPGADPFRVEALRLEDGSSGLAVVRQEALRAALEPLAEGLAGRDRLHLVLFVDQEAGRLAVLVTQDGRAGKPVDLVVKPLPGRAASGLIRLTLIAGDICLESLRVSAWKGEAPAADTRIGTAVVGRDGAVTAGEIDSFDRQAAALVMRTPAGPRRLPLDGVEEIGFPTAVDLAPPAGAVRLVRASGGIVSGDLLAVGGAELRLARAGIEGPIVVPLDDVVSLTSLATVAPRPLPGRVATLRAEGVTLRGCVVDGAPWRSGIAWLPQGAVAAAPLAAGAAGPPSAVVEYVARVDARPPGDPQVDVGGIGGSVNVDDEGFFVVTMLAEEGAAARDGRVQPGDRVLAIKPREDAGFVATKGLDQMTVMNLLRGRVGSRVSLRVAAGDGGDEREVELARGLIYVGGREVLEQALATHARFAVGQLPAAVGGRGFPALAILRSGDVVPCAVERIDPEAVVMRTPAADGGGAEPVKVATTLVQAIELDTSVAGRDIDRARFDRLLTLPRSQRLNPPTHMLRLRSGDYLRGRLVAVDAESVRIEVRGKLQTLPRPAVVRVIWLHPEEVAEHDGAAPPAANPVPADGGPVVQGVAKGRRMTLVAERVEGSVIHGRSPAFGTGRIDLGEVERLLVGGAIEAEADELPYRQWRLRPAPEPRALESAKPAPTPGD